MEDSPGNVNSDVEPAPEGSEVGVDIRGLRKVFKVSSTILFIPVVAVTHNGAAMGVGVEASIKNLH